MRFRLNIFNFYDYLVILLLAGLSAGMLGGAYSPTRLMAIAFSLFLIPSLGGIMRIDRSLPSYVFLFLVVMLLYVIVSFSWSLDVVQGGKEIIYYPVHFLLFLEIIWFSKKGKNPLMAICVGWLLATLITVPIGLRELIFDIHLDIAKVQGDTLGRMSDGVIAIRKTASATFGNYNGYVVFLIYTVFFMLCTLIMQENILMFVICFAVLGYSFITILINASRGGVVTIGILAVVFLFYYLKTKSNIKWILGLAALFVGGFLFYKFSDQILYQFDSRIQSSSMFTDDGRSLLIRYGFYMLFNSYLLGIGVGSIVMGYSEYFGTSYFITAPHNLIMELAVQYGIVILIMFLYLLYKIFITGWKNPQIVSRFAVVAFILSFPTMSIIDSMYLLNPRIWAYIACVCVFAEAARPRLPMRTMPMFIPPRNFAPPAYFAEQPDIENGIEVEEVLEDEDGEDESENAEDEDGK